MRYCTDPFPNTMCMKKCACGKRVRCLRLAGGALLNRDGCVLLVPTVVTVPSLMT